MGRVIRAAHHASWPRISHKPVNASVRDAHVRLRGLSTKNRRRVVSLTTRLFAFYGFNLQKATMDHALSPPYPSATSNRQSTKWSEMTETQQLSRRTRQLNRIFELKSFMNLKLESDAFFFPEMLPKKPRTIIIHVDVYITFNSRIFLYDSGSQTDT